MKKKQGLIVVILGAFASVIGLASIIWGAIEAAKQPASISIIGGADGPTTVFLVGKLGGLMSGRLLIVGVILLIIGIVMMIKNKRG